MSSILRNIKQHTGEHAVSILHSRSNNPYHNLAIENYLLRNSDQQSKILFFYTNRPCIVLGRNQNPWLECNIAKIQEGLPWRTAEWTLEDDILSTVEDATAKERERGNVPLDLVRRRSGGGTVIHDAGNLNFSFIVPNDKDFTRNTHAELVVRALMSPTIYDQFKEHMLYDKVRVNERHDIVMVRAAAIAHEDRKEFKVSGSAFKLTRGRALHHGTILHSSPNVNRQLMIVGDEGGEVTASVFSALLSSPAKPFLEAKGVASVRSPVHNLFDFKNRKQRNSIVNHLQEEIGRLFVEANSVKDIHVESVGDQDCQLHTNEDIYKDVQELTTDDWRFCQTPTFEYRSSDDVGGLKMQFQVKHGAIQQANLEDVDQDLDQRSRFASLEGKKLHGIQSWAEYFSSDEGLRYTEARSHLEEVFPRIQLANAAREAGTESTILQEAFLAQDKRGDIAVKRQSSGGKIETERGGENVVEER